MTVRILIGDCRDHLSQIDASSVDSIVTDPPYGLCFMGKGWDHGVPGVEFWTAALRVLKPGGHMLAFGGTRTHHRLMVAIEDAGFEIRDCLMWLYGSGFPKSLDVSKAIDKAAGVERQTIAPLVAPAGNKGRTAALGGSWQEQPMLTAPATDLAQQWDGWGTALKPAWEPIILARKPLTGTVAANVTAHSTGALNIDGCRIETTDKLGGGDQLAKTKVKADGWDRPWMQDEDAKAAHAERVSANVAKAEALGRWPANVVLDEDAAALLDAQSGERRSPSNPVRQGGHHRHDVGLNGSSRDGFGIGYGDTGGASRFFYTAKASRAERNKGLDGMQARRVDPVNHTDQRVWDIPGSHATPRANHHPTVKPIALMQWLCRLVTPPGGTVLDPFMGSGSTLIAAEREGFNAVGIELDPEYAEIARRRITGDCPLFVEVA